MQEGQDYQNTDVFDRVANLINDTIEQGDFSGLSVVISSNVETVMPRRPGVVGLYFLIPIYVSSLQCLEELDLFAVLCQGHDGLFRSSGHTDVSSHSL